MRLLILLALNVAMGVLLTGYGISVSEGDWVPFIVLNAPLWTLGAIYLLEVRA